MDLVSQSDTTLFEPKTSALLMKEQMQHRHPIIDVHLFAERSQMSKRQLVTSNGFGFAMKMPADPRRRWEVDSPMKLTEKALDSLDKTEIDAAGCNIADLPARNWPYLSERLNRCLNTIFVPQPSSHRFGYVLQSSVRDISDPYETTGNNLEKQLDQRDFVMSDR
jgi:hypothetical protein